ncbi:Beta-chimaerin [Orchesella cincta]|uniref:Beta-chimaerin n=1 Tax=Orchesella cincta TaxID=48709 RepID=A0A1D2MHD2_ORCCI|nr:Beta-chimaerin [Orchesella cincta]
MRFFLHADCGLSIHESCVDDVKSECKPDLTTTPPFSTDLTTLVKASYAVANGSCGLPYVLEKCINEVETRGLSTEGIYRVSGAVDEIESLKTLFEKDRINTDLSICSDIHSITGLIKLFLRQLPEPLITEEVFEEFFREEAGEMNLETVQNLILCLPPAHRLTLKHLLEHLQNVTMEKASNKMNAFNLSSVLMPSIVGPTNMSFNHLESCTKLLYVMITKFKNLNF